MAGDPLNSTSVTAESPEPLIVTTVPVGPLPGEKLVIRNGIVKDAALVAVPATFVTLMLPSGAAPSGTVMRIDVAVRWVIVPTSIPLRVPDVTESRFVPFTVTSVPTGPEAGVNELIVGGRITTKLVALVATPEDVVTETLPVTAVAPTVNVIVLSSPTLKPAAATVPTFTK